MGVRAGPSLSGACRSAGGENREQWASSLAWRSVEEGLGRHVRTGLDIAGLALTGQLAQRCSDIAYRLRAPAWALEQFSSVPESSASESSHQSVSGRDVVVVEYQFVGNASSVLWWPEESNRPNPLVLVSIIIYFFLSYSLFSLFCLSFEFYIFVHFVVIFVYWEHCLAHITILSGTSSCWYFLSWFKVSYLLKEKTHRIGHFILTATSKIFVVLRVGLERTQALSFKSLFGFIKCY